MTSARPVPTRARAAASLWLPLALCLPLGGCGGEAPRTAFLQASLTEPAALPRAIDLVLAAERLPAVAGARADFVRGRLAGAWSFLNTSAEPRATDAGVELELATDGRAEWTIDVDADAVSHLVLAFDELPAAFEHGTLRAVWRPAGSAALDWAAGPFVEVSYGEAEDGRLLVPLARDPRWRGRVTAIGLLFGSDATVRLASVKAVQLAAHLELPEPPADRLTPLVATIDQERRRTLRAAARSRVRDSLAVRPNEQLLVGFALHPLTSYAPGSATRFVVRIEDEIALDVTLGPRTDAGVGWHDRVLDLAPWAGREVSVELATEPAERRAGGACGIPLWTEPRVRLAAPAQAAPPNLLLVSFDTLRSDHLESYGYRHATSPTVSRLAREGVRFDHVRAHAPSTLPSHGSLFTGIEALENESRAGETAHLPRSRTTLAEVLRRHGYATAAFAGGAYFDPSFGLDRGFDTYAWANTRADPTLFDYSDVAANTRRAVDWIARNDDRPFFLFFHTYEVHSPFDPRAPWAAEFVPEGTAAPTRTFVLNANSRDAPLAEPDHPGWYNFVRVDGRPVDPNETTMAQVVASYDSEIRVADDHLRRLLAALAEHGVLDHTLVVFTSDHGESFLEHGRTGHGNLYEENLRVPLVIRYPRAARAGTVVHAPVQLVDVAPTCLELLGIDAPFGRGASLVPALTSGAPPPARPAIAWDSHSGIAYVAPDGRKLIANVFPSHPSAGRLEAYDLAGDAAEDEDALARLAPAERAELERGVARALERLPGAHVAFTSERPARFEGTLTLTGSSTVLRRALRVFPLQPGSFEFVDASSMRIATAPCERWLLHVRADDGELALAGTFRSDTGPEAVTVHERWDLARLPLAPAEPARRALDGDFALRVTARAIDPEADFDGAADGEGPSAETLEQLRRLGYF